LSWRIAVNSFFLLVATYFVGTYVLAFFGISLPVVQVGGGLIVIATGWSLLKQRDDEKEEVQEAVVQPQDITRRAFYPLTLPLTVGPASISAAITLGAERGSPSRVPSFDNPGCAYWIGADRDQHFALLWICRPVGASPGSNGDDGDHAVVVLFPGLYRCADRLERDESTAGVSDAACWLTKGVPLALASAGVHDSGKQPGDGRNVIFTINPPEHCLLRMR
jgi:hypothetical protein